MAKCKSCGSPLCSGCSAAKMKKDSPLDFLGGNVGFLARNLDRGAPQQSTATGVASSMASNALGLQRHAQRKKALMELVRSRRANRMPQEVAPVVNAPEVIDEQAPNANFSAYKKFTEAGIAPGAVNIVTPNMAPEQEVTNVPPPQANEAAVAPVFDQKTQVSANQVFGDLFARQNAVNAPLMFKKESPLKGNAFIAAKIAAEKAGKSSFKVGGKTFPVK